MAQEMLSKIGEVYGTAKNSRMASDKKSEKGFFGKLGDKLDDFLERK